MNKKYLFLSMILSAGLVFAACGNDEEQTEEVPAEDSVVVVEAPVDTTPVVEEAAAPVATKKAPAKKAETAVKAEETPKQEESGLKASKVKPGAAQTRDLTLPESKTQEPAPQKLTPAKAKPVQSKGVNQLELKK